MQKMRKNPLNPQRSNLHIAKKLLTTTRQFLPLASLRGAEGDVAIQCKGLISKELILFFEENQLVECPFGISC